jgi:hypothetical protein
MLRSSWAGTAPAARAAVHSCACGSSPSMLRMGSRRPICQRRPPAWAVTNAGLHLDLWFVSLDSEPALGTVVNLATRSFSTFSCTASGLSPRSRALCLTARCGWILESRSLRALHWPSL